MNKKISIVTISFVVISSFISACSSTSQPKKDYPATKKTNFTKQHTRYSPKKVIKTAKKMLGIKYHFGGASPKTGFDCSGLVYYTHKKQGLKLPRTTIGQFKRVKKIYKSALRPGDLVFFAIDRITVSHVGIYLGNNKFIHSPSTGKNVNITSMDNNYWRSRFITGGRL
ncbi:hypothetical protein MNBD_GAMMA22-682 [hydrothermal vent metagenome]|uniref:NlpC/P60 domain-containing protein n=1 Tax=hydrothermal vent metagenome TaxID=652676 RepID=A0A3B0ZIA8_9ZZZZ